MSYKYTPLLIIRNNSDRKMLEILKSTSCVTKFLAKSLSTTPLVHAKSLLTIPLVQVRVAICVSTCIHVMCKKITNK